MYKISCFLAVFVLFLQSCRKDEITFDTGEPLYSFFVAGHSYGNPTDTSLGLYVEFKDKFDALNAEKVMDFGVLTGDIVKNPTIEAWDAVDADLNELTMPVYFAAGNHDMKDRPLFESRYGDTYYSFTHQKDLFVVLDGNLDHWRISGDQLDFLKSTLILPQVENIFIFSHQLIYADIRPDIANSEEDKAEELNFKTEVMPLLEATNKRVFVMAGDVGAFYWSIPLFHDKYEGVTLIASGMGGGVKDNFLIADVMPNKTVRFRVVALNGNDVNAMGQLVDY